MSGDDGYNNSESSKSLGALKQFQSGSDKKTGLQSNASIPEQDDVKEDVDDTHQHLLNH
jgi:hypothetical protein